MDYSISAEGYMYVDNTRIIMRFLGITLINRNKLKNIWLIYHLGLGLLLTEHW